MPSPDKKLLVLGDSNVAMIKELMTQDGAVMGFTDVSFWYQTGSAFNTITVTEGQVSCRAQGALPPVTLCDYDHILWAGGRLRTSQIFEPAMSAPPGSFSDGFVSDYTMEYLDGLPAIRSLRAMREQFSGPITVLTTPLRGAGIESEDLKEAHPDSDPLYDRIWQVYRDFAAGIGTELIPIPRSMIETGCLVQPRYHLAPDDDLHKNAGYARDLLAEVGKRGRGNLAA